MRLICPNCGAQYEVDESLVPDPGRDVQCSNCGHAWFQIRPDLDAGLADELGLEPAETAPAPAASEHAVEGDGDDTGPQEEDDAAPGSSGDGNDADGGRSVAGTPPETDTDVFAPMAEPRPGRTGITGSESKSDDLQPDPTVSADIATGQNLSAPPRPAMDADIRRILAEEGAREAQARARENARQSDGHGGGESGSGAGESGTRPDSARQRTAPGRPDAGSGLMRPATPRTADLPQREPQTSGRQSPARPAEEEPPAARSSSRRDLLPAIDEVKSSLRTGGPAGEAGATGTQDAAPRGGSLGFSLILLFAIVALLIYAFAGNISTMFPAAEPVLSAYTGWVNALRGWLDSGIQSLLDWVNGSQG